MDINKLIKECHENAVEKGFYDCPECGGDCTGRLCVNCRIYGKEKCNGYTECPHCKGTGIDQNKNISELLMFAIVEISKAVEALINGKLSDWSKDINIDCKSWNMVYIETYIKDTFEDKITDVFIRLFELCGYLGIEIDDVNRHNDLGVGKLFDFPDLLLFVVRVISEIQSSETDKKNNIECAFSYLFDVVKKYNIDIEKHIDAKIAYNKTK